MSINKQFFALNKFKIISFLILNIFALFGFFTFFIACPFCIGSCPPSKFDFSWLCSSPFAVIGYLSIFLLLPSYIILSFVGTIAQALFSSQLLNTLTDSKIVISIALLSIFLLFELNLYYYAYYIDKKRKKKKKEKTITNPNAHKMY